MSFLNRNLLIASILIVAVDAHADLDLTGSWNVTSFLGVSTVAIVQSGPNLIIGSYTGTIDPLTREFILESPPSPGGILFPGFAYGPSPPGFMSGTVAADGNSLDALQGDWIVKTSPGGHQATFPWFRYEYDIHGVRRDLSTCGNGQIGAEEFCDDGTSNGLNGCCSSICTVVDTDGDETCDAEDDCPLIYDYYQSCAAPLTVTAARVDPSGRLRARGTLSSHIGSFAESTLTVGEITRTFALRSCQSVRPSLSRVRCIMADGLRLYIRRRAFPNDSRFLLRATGLPVQTDRSGPIAIEIVDTANHRIGYGEASRCIARNGNLSCTGE